MRGKDELKGELKFVREEKDVAVAHTKNINRKYDNAQAAVSEMEYDQIKPQSRIYDVGTSYFLKFAILSSWYYNQKEIYRKFIHNP